MTEFPKGIKFRYTWRKYQQRILDELQEHLSDGHLHVIAPPGSGKTVLGLEVALRLNKPTLILAPTIAIRNQWVQRFCDLFLQTDIPPEWISRDIRRPRFITVVTYQGLHAACSNNKVDEEKETEDDDDINETTNNQVTELTADNIIGGLKSQNIKTIIVDEAHHLKNEWWNTLTKVKQKLNPTIVGLTATPPYDVTALEWERYVELNGPVDAEISVPELIVEGDLCPHQDYVYLSLPSTTEFNSIVQFRQNIQKLFDEIEKDEVFIKAIEQHPIVINPKPHLEWIYSNISIYSACLIFLSHNQRVIPEAHLDVVGDKKLKIPKLDYQWMETLLDFYLFKEKKYFKAFENHRKIMESRLRRCGAIEKKTICLSYNKGLTNLLTSSIGKLESISQIVSFEHKVLGNDLRLVILTDFIRKEFLVNTIENNLELNKIGAIPIFEKLRRESNVIKKIGVLTGSLIIIPVTAYSAFEATAAQYGIKEINASPVSFDNTYILILQSEALKHDIVHIITQIFQTGDIQILIGTKSLLGEGWDAPAINSLILASFVGSFVLSNQMRGRAIRAQNGNKNKTANIWHLACIDPTFSTGGEDFDLLKRRFRTFVGITSKDIPVIENGIDRLKLPISIFQPETVNAKNVETFHHAGDRQNLKHRWEAALKKGLSLVEEIKIPFKEEMKYKEVKSMYFTKTIKNLLVTLTFGLITFAQEALEVIARAARNIKTFEDLYWMLASLGALGFIIFGRQTFRTLKLYLKYRDITKDIQKIAEALVSSLSKADAVHTDASKLLVKTSVDEWGCVYCHLEGGTTLDKSIFINALRELIAPIKNPRYIIIRKNRFLSFITQKDYHSVPEVLGQNKTLAEHFKSEWEQIVGRCDLVFTRTIEGRKLILQSRVRSLAAQLEDRIQHVNKWR